MKIELKKKAQELREQGKSLNEIVLLLGVSKSTASIWTNSIVLSEQDKANLNARRGFAGGDAMRQKHRLLRSQYQEEGRAQAKKLEPEHLMGCMLYWAEGTKSKNQVKFTNCDSEMVLVFKKFLLKYFDLAVEDFKISINCYLNNGLTQSQVEEYWLMLLGLRRESLCKSVWKSGKDGESFRKNRHNYGVCSLYVSSTRIVHHIYGAIQEYTGMNRDWLF